MSIWSEFTNNLFTSDSFFSPHHQLWFMYTKMDQGKDLERSSLEEETKIR